jgi:hypothetical protein
LLTVNSEQLFAVLLPGASLDRAGFRAHPNDMLVKEMDACRPIPE